MLSPGGGVPELTDQRYGGKPPAAVIVIEYCEFTTPFGNVVVLIVTGGLIVRLKVPLAVVFWLSVTLTTKENVPGVEALPALSTPEVLNEKPSGSAPDVRDQV
jgi:hypothetical protein